MFRTLAERCLWIATFLAVTAAALAVAAKLLAAQSAGPAVVEKVEVMLLAALLVLAFGAGRRRLGAGNAGHPLAEVARLATLAAFALWAFRPYFTPLFFGGLDATSYAYGMSDALQQERAGTFPVFVGQSEFMFEGVIHPIRTAPYHHYFGMLLDLLTSRVLRPVAIEHMTVLLGAVLAALVTYACLASLAPRRRGAAWLQAAIYVSAPAFAGFIYTQEMYMTFMALAWLPLVVYANLRLLRADDATGWTLLAAGSALLWICHPAIGLWGGLLSGLLQGWRLLQERVGGFLWQAAAAAVLFAGLAAYYFWSMIEIATSSAVTVASRGANLTVLGGLLLGFGLLLRHLATARRIWLGLALAIAVALWFFFRPYALWLGAACLLTGLGRALAARLPKDAWRVRLPEISLGIALLAGLCVLPWCARAEDIPAWNIIRGLFPRNLSPLSAGANLPGDIQLGYPVLAVSLLGLAAAFRTSRLDLRFAALALVVGFALMLPIPGVTRLLVAMMPEIVTAISSVSLWQRYMPVLLVLAVFLGFLGLDVWSGAGRRTGWVLLLALAAGTAWSTHNHEKFVRNGYGAIRSTGNPRDFDRTENLRQFAYIFSNLPLSPYLLNGVADYHLESRLLRGDDPNVELGETVPWPDVRWQPLQATTDELNSRFLNLTPTLTLNPGEHRLLRFRFVDRAYDGVLVMRGPRGWYREYFFPNAGFGEKSFGVDPARPKTVAIWNASEVPQPVEMVFILNAIPNEKMPPAVFADLAMTSYDPAHLPIQTRSLIPYRAHTEVSAPAWLETPRMFIPGYRANVNGHVTPVQRSPNQRVMIRLEPGANDIALRYVGTAALWTAFVVSTATWLGLGVYFLGRKPEPVPEAAS